MSSTHLSRVLSPVISVFIPSDLADRPDPFVLLFDASGVETVGVVDAEVDVFLLAAATLNGLRVSKKGEQTGEAHLVFSS